MIPLSFVGLMVILAIYTLNKGIIQLRLSIAGKHKE